MKRIIVAAILAIALAGTVNAQDPLSQAWQQFENGAITNFSLAGGGIYGTAKNDWGGELAIRYNTPKWSFPFEPYIVPEIGVIETGDSWYGFSGGVTIQKDIHPLSGFAGNNTNGFAAKFTLTPGITEAVIVNMSGEQFGSFKIPGAPPANGQGTGALTGEELTASIGSWGQWKFAITGGHKRISTLSGDFYDALAVVQWFPKGW